jgi:hypothetical protein
VLGCPEQEIQQIRASLQGRLEPFTKPDGTLEIPMRTLVAAATA